MINEKPNTILDKFEKEMKLILPRDEFLRTILMNFANKIVTKSTTGPDVLTIAACNSCFTSLNNSLPPVFEKYLHYRVINVDVAENEKEAEFYEKMMSLLSNVEGKAVVFINGMDRMKEKTPLVLQTISDENSAKYKNAILIFLILDDEISRQTGLDCDKKIFRLVLLLQFILMFYFSHLLEHWKNPLLLEDQVYPIVSRVTKMTACYSF